MKNRFLRCVIVALCIMSAIQIKAQVDQKVKIGMVFSPQISLLKSDDAKVDKGSGLFGFNFGITLDRYFTSNYAINTGITINTTGGNQLYPDGLNMTISDQTSLYKKMSYRLKYIEIPLALKLRTNDFGRLAYYGVFGLSGQINIKSNDGDGNSLSEYVRDLNTAYHFGGGVEYSMGGSTYLMFGLQFHNGFTDITKHAELMDQSVLNRLVFNMGVIF